MMMTRNIENAVQLLQDDNLVWSADMEDIKGDLAGLLLVSAAQGDIMQTLAENLAKKIIHPIGSSFHSKLEKR